MKNVEYRVLSKSYGELASLSGELTILAFEGWRVVTSTGLQAVGMTPASPCVMVILEREIVAKPQ